MANPSELSVGQSAGGAVQRLGRRLVLSPMKIGIVGLGYVGLPLAVAFAEAGHEVVGLDADPRKVEALAPGRSYIEDIPDRALAPLGERLQATSDYAELASCDAVVICVPTPLTGSREPDLTYLLDAATALSQVLQPEPARRPGVDHLPGHHPRAAAADPRGVGAGRGRRLPPRLLAGADRPRPHRLHDPHHAEAGRRGHRGLRRARPRALLADLRRGRRPLHPRGGRALEAAGEHLPLGQHRPRQRARPALRPARRSTSGR